MNKYLYKGSPFGSSLGYPQNAPCSLCVPVVEIQEDGITIRNIKQNYNCLLFCFIYSMN